MGLFLRWFGTVRFDWMLAGIENTSVCTMVLVELGKEGLLPAVLINEIKNREWCELALKSQFPTKHHENVRKQATMVSIMFQLQFWE